jgi:hypothetical protein
MTSPWEHSVQLLAAAVQNPSVIQMLFVMAGWAAALRRRPVVAATGAALIWARPPFSGGSFRSGSD